MSMVRSYLFEEFLRKRLIEARGPPTEFHTEYATGLGLLTGRKPMTVRYKVPAADIVEAWKAQKAKYEVDLQEALATQKDLREKDVNDSCVNGKVDHGRRCILVLDLQIKYIDHDEDIYLGDHEMLNIFSAPGHLNGPTGMGAEVAQERRY